MELKIMKQDSSYTVQPPPAKGARLSRDTYRSHISTALRHAGFSTGWDGVTVPKRYRLEWQAQIDGGELREQPEEWTGAFTPYSKGLRLIEPGAVHSLCVSEKHTQFRELIATIDIQF